MPTQPEPSQSAVSVLDEALADLHLIRACLDELREPGAALVPRRPSSGVRRGAWTMWSPLSADCASSPPTWRRAHEEGRSEQPERPSGFCTPTTPSHPKCVRPSARGQSQRRLTQSDRVRHPVTGRAARS